MTRDEIIAQLRDIHLPPTRDVDFGLVFAWWPLALFAVAGIVLLGLAAWRRNAWRRAARERLRRIKTYRDRGERWRALLRLALDISRARIGCTPLPEAAYRAPQTIDDGDVAALAEHVRRATRR
jgi:hypothetical protein